MIALEEERFRRAGKAPVGLIAVTLGEIALGAAVAAYDDDPTAGAVLIAGGVTHGAMAWFSIEANHRRKRAFYSRLDSFDPTRPGAVAALAESLRRSAENDARWQTFTLGAHLALPVAGALSEVLDCTRLFEGACEPAPVLALGVVGLAGGIHSASRFRAAARLSSDFGIIDQQVPTLLP